MATPGDPLRAMAEKYAVDKPAKLAEVQGRIDAFAAKMEQTARERGVPVGDLTSMRQQMIGLEKEKALVEARQALHTYNPEDALHGDWLPEQVASMRIKAGFPEEGVGVSPTARAWENASDAALNVAPASKHTRPLSPYEITRGIRSTVDTNPWLLKVPPETPVYYPERGLSEDLGFNHLVDELRNATNPESGLPKNLLIDPADLSKLTMAQAVDRVADINAWRATQKAEADLLRANNAATQVVKEYPEQGMKWVELKMPETLTELPPGYKAEPYKSQYSEGVKILNPAGEQVSVGETLDDAFKNMNELRLEDALKYEGDTMAHCVGGYCPDVVEGKSRIYSLRDDKGQPRVTIEVAPWRSSQGESLSEFEARLRTDPNRPEEAVRQIMSTPQYADKIVQIKGFNNKKPADEFLPFVQDFVKSGKWSDVGDLQNTGLVKHNGKIMTQGEADDLIFKELNEAMPGITDDLGLTTPTQGFAQGGLVSNHFDPIKIKQIIASLDDDYDPQRIQQIIAHQESSYA